MSSRSMGRALLYPGRWPAVGAMVGFLALAAPAARAADGAAASASAAASVAHHPAPAPTRTPVVPPPPPTPAAAARGPAAAPRPETAKGAVVPPPPTSAPAAKKGPAPSTSKGAKGTKPPAAPARARAADLAARRAIAGGPTVDDIALGAESPELRALREAERELFPPAAPALGAPWPSELPSPMWSTEDHPRVHASGLPPSPPPSAPPLAEGGRDLSWLSGLTMPDLPVRWEPRLVRYLELFKSEPRWRSTFAIWLKRSGRYGDLIRRTLRRKSLPEDLLWAAVVESGLDPMARSHAGAVGLWQFMVDVGRLYGLSSDRWLDERMSVVAATDAAADMFADLYRRFGSWELSLAGYNMGYAGLAGVMRRYNTNDYWTLCRLEGALPWETTLHVPKVVAAAIVGRNLATFGFDGAAVDPPFEADVVAVAPAVPLSVVAAAAGVTTKEVEALNPELRSSRTPPSSPDGPGAPFGVRVPLGRGAVCSQSLARQHKDAAGVERYVVRFGESLEQIAASHKVSLEKIVELNAIGAGEVVRGGTVLLLPRGGAAPLTPSAKAVASTGPTPATGEGTKPAVVVPADVFVYPHRQRVFYRVVVGDTLKEVAESFRVTVDDLRRWNDLDPSARLQDGMTLQIFAPADADLSKAVLFTENDVRVLPVGSDEFFAYWVEKKGQKRVSVVARPGDTLDAIGRRYGVRPASMERINRRNRSDALSPGEVVVLYLPSGAPGTAGAVAKAGLSERALDDGPTPLGPLPDAPAPDALPRLP